MGQTTFKPRKATFTVSGTGSKRVLTAVNQRAKIVVCKVYGLGNHKRKNYPAITIAQLRATKGKGTYRFYAYTDTGLKAIR